MPLDIFDYAMYTDDSERSKKYRVTEEQAKRIIWGDDDDEPDGPHFTGF